MLARRSLHAGRRGGGRGGGGGGGGRLEVSHSLYCMVLMSNPTVGLIPATSSPFSCFTTVVLPALSRPLREGTSPVSPPAAPAGEHEMPNAPAMP